MNLQKALDSIPSQIDIILDDRDYDDNGNSINEYKNEDYMIDTPLMSIECSIHITEKFRVSPSSYTNPSETNVISEGIWIDNFKVFDEDHNRIFDVGFIQKAYNRFVESINIC